MSDFSEEIQRVLEASSEEGETAGAAEIVDISCALEKKLYPGFEGMQTHYAQKVMSELRVVFLKHAGSKPFETPSNAVDRIGSSCMKRMMPMLLHVLADGIQIGQGDSFPVKKYRTMKKMDDIYDSKTFLTESELMSMSFMEDQDVVDLMVNYLKSSLGYMGAASGYVHYSGEKLNKIWDLWAISFTSCCIGLFIAGHKIGAAREEEGVLQGILSATEGREDG